jgi:hypothetical protein
MDDDVRKALEETHDQLLIRDHQLLCIGSWLFQPTESNIWEFYRFTFYEKPETEQHKLFNSIQRSWNDSTGEELTTKQATQWWRNMIVSIFQRASYLNIANEADCISARLVKRLKPDYLPNRTLAAIAWLLSCTLAVIFKEVLHC